MPELSPRTSMMLNGGGAAISVADNNVRHVDFG